jgi:hypothetical protein
MQNGLVRLFMYMSAESVIRIAMPTSGLLVFQVRAGLATLHCNN